MNDRTVQSQGHLREIRIGGGLAIESVGAADEHLSHRRKNAPIPMLVGVGKIGPRHPAPQAHVVSQVETAVQTSDNITQAFPISHLSKAQGQKMIVGAEGPRRAGQRKPLHATDELRLIKISCDLGENGRAGRHAAQKNHPPALNRQQSNYGKSSTPSGAFSRLNPSLTGHY